MPLSRIGRLGSGPSHTRSPQRSGVAPNLVPFQGGRSRVLFGGFGQPVEEHLVGEVVLQRIAAQEWKTGDVEVAGAPSGLPSVQRHNNSLVSGVLGARQKAGGQVL